MENGKERKQKMNQTLTRKQFDILSILAEEKVLYPRDSWEKRADTLWERSTVSCRN